MSFFLLGKLSAGFPSLVRKKPQTGFTLIEVLVAIVIFSFVSVMSYEAMTGVIDYVNRSRVTYAWQNQLHRSNALIMQDMLHLRPRPVRERLGGQLHAYHTTDPDYVVQFTRGGLPSVQGSTFGGMQRVAYSVSDDSELLRWTWPVLDAFISDEPRSQVILTSVESFQVFQLNSRNEYEENWPPLNENIAIHSLPRLIRYEIVMLNGDTIERIIPGVENVPDGDDPFGIRAQRPVEPGESDEAVEQSR